MKPYRKKEHFFGEAYQFVSILGVFLFTVCLFVGVFWFYGRREEKISLEKTYYFLVRDCEDETASAVAGEVYLFGGAGYLLESAGKTSVALACYFKESDCLRVQTTLEEKGIFARLLSLSTKEFRVESKTLKKKIEETISTVDDCAHILYETANGLERAELTQDEARAALKGVNTSLRGLSLEEDEAFALWDHALLKAEQRGKEISEGILFAKDLRYLQIQICMEILSADVYFG